MSLHEKPRQASFGYAGEDAAEQLVDELIESWNDVLRRFPNVPHLLAMRPAGWPEEPQFASEIEELRWELRRVRALDRELSGAA